MLNNLTAKVRRFFKDSETLFLARAQMLVGVTIEVIAATDPQILAPLIPVKWFGPYLIIAGIVTEVARRARDKTLQ